MTEIDDFRRHDRLFFFGPVALALALGCVLSLPDCVPAAATEPPITEALAPAANVTARIEPAVPALDPYLQILSYRCRQGMYAADPKKTYLRVLVKTSRPNEEIPGLPAVSRINDIFTSYCFLSELEKLGRLPGVEKIEIGSRCATIQSNPPGTGSDDVPPAGGKQREKLPTGKGVVVGIIDSGLDAGLPEFSGPGKRKSRVISLWDQTDQSGKSPSVFGREGYGTEYDRKGLAAAVKKGLPAVRDAYGHGTTIAALCAGRNGIAPEADIIFVKSSGATAETVDAVKYVFERAARIHRPCVINLSYGEDIGRHNGSSLLEQALSAMTGKGKILLSSAGNRLEPFAFASTSESGEISFSLRLKGISPPRNGDPAGSKPVLIISGRFDSLEIGRLSPPSGREIIHPGQTGHLRFPDSGNLFFAWEPRRTGDDSEYLLLQWDLPGRGDTPQEWHLAARRDPSGSRACLVQAWIDEGLDVLSFPFAGNLPANEVAAPASAAGVLGVACSDEKGNPSPFSPSPFRIQGHWKPEFYAPGERIRIISGPRKGRMIDGSSFSTAKATASVARLLQFFPGLAPLEVKEIFFDYGRLRSGSNSKPECGFLFPDDVNAKMMEYVRAWKKIHCAR